MFKSHLKPSVHRKLIRLVGRRCEVRCKLNGLETKGLWDTGAMISGISKSWLMSWFPELEVRDIRELLDEPLDIRSANQGKMPFEGWVELTFQMSTGSSIQVPFLVLSGDLSTPIIGFNVIFELLKEKSVDLLDELRLAFGLDENKFEQTVNIIEAAGCDSLCAVRSVKKSVKVAAGEKLRMKCRAAVGFLEADTPVLFQPDVLQEWPEELQINEQLLMLKKGVTSKVAVSVVNVSNHSVVIPGNTVLGDLELVSSVTPVDVKMAKMDESATDKHPSCGEAIISECSGVGSCGVTSGEEVVGNSGVRSSGIASGDAVAASGGTVVASGDAVASDAVIYAGFSCCSARCGDDAGLRSDDESSSASSGDESSGVESSGVESSADAISHVSPDFALDRLMALPSVGEVKADETVNMSSQGLRALPPVGEAKGFDVHLSLPKDKRALSSVGEEDGSDNINMSLPNMKVRALSSVGRVLSGGEVETSDNVNTSLSPEENHNDSAEDPFDPEVSLGPGLSEEPEVEG